MKIGVLGMGKMGAPMARNMLKAGHEVTVYNRTAEKARALEADGAKVSETPAGAAGGDVVVSMLFNDADVEGITLGPGGLVEAMRPGAVHLCMSTIATATSERLARAHEEAGQGYVAAPVVGRPDMAEAGTVFVIAGGKADAMAKVDPILDAVGQRTFHVGEDPAAANLMKLSVNFMLCATMTCIGEAAALARKRGVDPAAYVEILTGTVFSAPAFQTYGRIIAEQDYDTVGARLPIGVKDLGQLLEAAASRDVPMPVAEAIRRQYQIAMERGYENKDWAVVAKISAEDAGLE